VFAGCSYFFDGFCDINSRKEIMMSNFIKNIENDLKALTKFLVGTVEKKKSAPKKIKKTKKKGKK